jgi:hypothetical protein
VTVVGALTALWLGVPSQSQADPLIINLPEGQFQVTGFDPGPGNLLITNIPTTGLHAGTVAPGPGQGSVLETYYQANMSALLGTNNNNPIPGLGLNQTYEMAVVARFTEIVTSLTIGANSISAGFALAPLAQQQNPFYEIWFHNGLVNNNLAGTGFATGTKILSGVIGNLTNSTFNETDTTVIVPIDNPPPDGGGTAAGKAYWNNNKTLTVTGTGNNTVTIATMQVNSVVLNPTFFPAGQTVTGMVGRPSTGLEYQNVDPSQQLDSMPNAGGFISSIPTGIINGVNFTYAQAQTDSTQAHLVIEDDDKYSVSATAVIPEPSTIALSLIGVGVLGCARAVRRRKATA